MSSVCVDCSREFIVDEQDRKHITCVDCTLTVCGVCRSAVGRCKTCEAKATGQPTPKKRGK